MHKVTVLGLCVCVCVYVYLSVTTLAATAFTFKQKIRYHRHFFMVFSTHGFRQKSFVLEILACLYNCGCLLSIENTPAVLDTTRTDIVCEALATATAASKIEQLSFTSELLCVHQNC